MDDSKNPLLAGTLFDREIRLHELKCWPVHFYAVRGGLKPFEVRKDDRGFQRGDVLALMCWDPAEGDYVRNIITNKIDETLQRITYVLHGGDFGIEPGYVVLGLAPYPSASFMRLDDDERREKLAGFSTANVAPP